jgi:hypothetical protein
MLLITVSTLAGHIRNLLAGKVHAAALLQISLACFLR